MPNKNCNARWVILPELGADRPAANSTDVKDRAVQGTVRLTLGPQSLASEAPPLLLNRVLVRQGPLSDIVCAFERR